MSDTSFNPDHQVGVEEGDGGEKIMVKFTKSGNLVTTRMDVAVFRKCCQADDCSTDLNNTKEYYKRHKVCELHAKASVVMVKSLPQRFCQQCSKFHDVAKFDYVKRSCRDRLAYHNERRRKSVQGKDPVGGPSSPQPQAVSTNIRGLMAKRHLNLNETAIQSGASSSSLSTIVGNHHHHHHHHPIPNTPNLLEMALHNAPSYQAYAKAMMMANQQRTFF